MAVLRSDQFRDCREGNVSCAGSHVSGEFVRIHLVCIDDGIPDIKHLQQQGGGQWNRECCGTRLGISVWCIYSG